MIRFRMFKISVPQFDIYGKDVEPIYNIKTDVEIKNTSDGKAIAVIMTFTFIGKEETAMVLKVMCEFGIHPEDLESLTSD